MRKNSRGRKPKGKKNRRTDEEQKNGRRKGRGREDKRRAKRAHERGERSPTKRISTANRLVYPMLNL